MKYITACIVFLCSVAMLCGCTAYAATVTDVTSSKNLLYLDGPSPRIQFSDNDAQDYLLKVDGNVLQFQNLSGNAFFNAPPTGTIGIELSAPTGVAATVASGGSLAPSTTYYFVVTATDGFGETVKSSEVTCTTTASDRTCVISWTIVPPPASGYRVYMGVSSGTYTSYATTTTSPYSATTDPLPFSGAPPDSTTAYFIRLSPTGIHYSDGTVQISAGGSAAWQIPPPTSNILSAQTGNVGIFDGVTIFSPDAKLTVRCPSGRCIGINDVGVLAAYPTNNVHLISNLRAQTNTLWDTSKSSWLLSVGDGADNFVVWRAAPTTGTPSYVKILDITSTTFQSQLFSAVFGAGLTSPGVYTFRGSVTDVNINSAAAQPSSLNLNVAGSKVFSIASDGTGARVDFPVDLEFHSPPGGPLVLTLSSSGNLIGIGDYITFGRVRGSGMTKHCASTGIFTKNSDASINLVVTSSFVPYPHSVYVVGAVNAHYYFNSTTNRGVVVELRRNDTTVLHSGTTYYTPTSSAVSRVPMTVSVMDIDTPASGTYTYNIRVSNAPGSGSFDAGNLLEGTAKICAYLLP